MHGHHKLTLGAFLAVSMATAAFAQETSKATVIDCDAEFLTLDVNGDGYLSDTEAPREYARSRIDAMTLQEVGISKGEFQGLCGGKNWADYQPEEGAPFEGKNSFTEDQARDRAVAWNVMYVSALVLDPEGIWRGTGKVDGADVSIAVDFKGNVVTAPKS